MSVHRLEGLDQRALVAADEDRENVALMAGRRDRRVITAVHQKGVAVPRHHDLRFTAFGLVAKLRAESGLGPEAIMIDFLEVRFLGWTLRVVLVRRITGPAT